MGPIELKSFSTTKELIEKMKRQATESEKILANNVINKILISEIYKQLIQAEFLLKEVLFFELLFP